MKNSLIHYLIIFVFIFGIYGAGGLVLDEYQIKHICPQILGIPACYIIMICLLVPFIAHVFDLSHKIYFAGVGIALIIATYGSVGNFFGFAKCPKSSYGTPLCYLSFLLFATLAILKGFKHRMTKV